MNYFVQKTLEIKKLKDLGFKNEDWLTQRRTRIMEQMQNLKKIIINLDPIKYNFTVESGIRENQIMLSILRIMDNLIIR